MAMKKEPLYTIIGDGDITDIHISKHGTTPTPSKTWYTVTINHGEYARGLFETKRGAERYLYEMMVGKEGLVEPSIPFEAFDRYDFDPDSYYDIRTIAPAL